MNDEPLEPLDIDDRSPGERMVTAGRAGIDRLSEGIDDARLDVVALIWMVSTTAFVSVQIYSAFHLFGGGGGVPGYGTWEKVAALGQTGGPIVALTCLAGIALGAWFDSAAARVTMFLAVLVGAWVLTAGVLAAVAAARSTGGVTFGFGSENRAVGIVGGFALTGLGLVVVMIVWPLMRGRSARVSPPQSTLR